MGNFFDKLFKRDATPATELERNLAQVLSGDFSDVSAEGSLSISAVWACVRILSETVASLPLHLYKKTKGGNARVESDKLLDLLRRPNSYSGTYDFLQWEMIGVLLRGNSYTWIIRDVNGVPKRLHFCENDQVIVSIDRDKDEIVYRYKGNIIPSTDMIHLKGICTDGYMGKSPISVHRENLLLSQNVLTYGQKFFTNGGNTEGVYTYPGELKEDAYQRLKRNINEQESLRNAHKSLLLEGGMKYERVNIPLEDAQFITTRKFQATEVARIFGVPPHLIADLERSTNNNIEHQGIEFVVYTLLPYLKKLEAELNYKLLTTDQAKKMYFSFNVNGLMRGDSTARANFYRTMYTISAMNPNEIRRLENMNEYEGGEIYFTQANMQPVKAISETENE